MRNEDLHTQDQGHLCDPESCDDLASGLAFTNNGNENHTIALAMSTSHANPDPWLAVAF